MTVLAAFAGLLAGAYLISSLQRWVSGARLAAIVLGPAEETIALCRQHDAVPAGADDLLFRSAPIFALASMALAALFVPAGPTAIAIDASAGLFFFVVLFSPFVIAMMNAGWGANGKQGLFGAFRAAAHLLSYEVPLGFAVIGPAMAAESLSTAQIVGAQSGLWFGLWQPLGLALYLVAALIASFRHPFDLPQAGSELGGGVLAEYSGPRLALFRLALDANFFLLMAMGATLFLGGWRGPLLPGPVWLLLKTITLATVTLLVARRFPRLRHDQMLSFSWKVLLPASLLNIVAVGIPLLWLRPA